MSSKFNTAKHRRRLRKERENRNENHRNRTARQCNEARIRIEVRGRHEEYPRHLEAEKLADPRRPLAQRLVNALAQGCWRDPAFRLLALQEALRQMGVPFTPAVQIIDGVPVIVIESPEGVLTLITPVDVEKISEKGQGHLERTV